MSELDLDAIEARAEAANAPKGNFDWDAGMAFADAAWEDIPALVSRVRELEAIIRRVAEYTVGDTTVIRVAGELQDILGDEFPEDLS